MIAFFDKLFIKVILSDFTYMFVKSDILAYIITLLYLNLSIISNYEYIFKNI